MTLKVRPMPPVARMTVGASNSTKRPVSLMYPKAPAIWPEADFSSRVTVVSANTRIRASGSPDSMASSCCSATTRCCSVRIISRPVLSPTCARRGYSCPPKFRWEILPSGVRSKIAPHASSSQTRFGASLACSSAIRGLFRNFPPRMVSRKCTCQLSLGFTLPMAAAAPPSAMTVCALPNSDLEMIAVFRPARPRLDRRPQPGAAGADHYDVVGEALDIGVVSSHNESSPFRNAVVLKSRGSLNAPLATSMM